MIPISQISRSNRSLFPPKQSLLRSESAITSSPDLSSAETSDVLVSLPSYLSKHNYSIPNATSSTLFRFAKSTPLSFYEWLQLNPQQARIFYDF